MCIQARTKGCKMFKSNRTTTTARIATLVLAATMLAGAAPASAAQTTYDTKTPALTTLEQSAPVAKFTVTTPAATGMTTTAVKAAAPVKALVTATTVKPAATTNTSATKRAATGSESAQAKAILAGLIGRYPILQGTTVSFGDARGYQAIALYKSGRIVINPAHTASLSRILDHEVWHIIDWRDNGVIDWGENIPAH